MSKHVIIFNTDQSFYVLGTFLRSRAATETAKLSVKKTVFFGAVWLLNNWLK